MKRGREWSASYLRFAGAVSAELNSPRKLESLYLDANQFAATVPATLARPSHSETPDLSDYRLAGPYHPSRKNHNP